MALREQLRRPHGSQQLVPRCIHVRCAVNHKHKHRACRETAGELHVRRVATTTTLSTEQSWSQQGAATPGPAAQPQVENFDSSFNWLSYWYPVQVLASADPSRPHAIELLGKQLVLWRDGEGSWRCMEDLCPHRLAPLSEGRIESDGTLQCSYHGWRFNSQGKCTEIPQAIDEKAKQVACSSSRSCVTSYPVREDAGLIWVWPSAGPAAAAEAAAAPTPLSKQMLQDYGSGKPQGTWYRRELPYSWDVLVENLTDPSHLPFSHHNLSPALQRKKGEAPMPFAAIDIPAGTTPEDAAARPGYVMEHRAPLAAYEFPSAMSPAGRVTFTPPINVTYEYNIGPTSRLQNDLIAVPAGPGRSVAYTIGRSNVTLVNFNDLVKALFTNPTALPLMYIRYKYQRQAAYKGHLTMNKLFDQDSLFLYMQDRILASKGRSSWAKSYYMPTQADGLVIAGRKWADFALQLPLPGSKAFDPSKTPTAADAIALSAAEAAMAKPGTQEEAGDRYNQHTKHCVLCQQALKGLKQRLQFAQAAAAGLAAAVIGVLAGVVVPGLFDVVSSGIAAPTAGAVAAGVLAAAALVARSIAAAAAKKIAEFHYVGFNHADNH